MLVSATYWHVILSCHKVQKGYNLPEPLSNEGEVNTLGCFSLCPLPLSQGLWCKWQMSIAVFLRLMIFCHEVLTLSRSHVWFVSSDSSVDMKQEPAKWPNFLPFHITVTVENICSETLQPSDLHSPSWWIKFKKFTIHIWVTWQHITLDISTSYSRPCRRECLYVVIVKYWALNPWIFGHMFGSETAYLKLDWHDKTSSYPGWIKSPHVVTCHT